MNDFSNGQKSFLLERGDIQRHLTYESSLSQMFFKIGVLKNFVNFTGKHLC